MQQCVAIVDGICQEPHTARMTKSVGEKVSIDEALAETKYGRFNYGLIVVSGLTLINVVLECVGISFVLPVINCDMNLTYQEKGILGAVGFLGIISSSHLWGFLADTTGRRNVIRLTLIGGYLVTVVSSFSPNFVSLAVLRYVNGFLLSGGSATIFAYLGEFHCNAVRNRAIMSASLISAIAAILFPISAWAAINQTWSFEIPLLGVIYKPWRMYLVIIGIFGFISGVCLFYFPESPKYLLSSGREEEAIATLKKIYRINTNNSEDSYRVESLILDAEEMKRLKVSSEKNGCALIVLAKTMWQQTAPLFMREHYRKTVLACIIQFWIFFTAHGLYMWFPFILNKVMQFTNANPTMRLELCDILYIMGDGNGIIGNSTVDSQNDCNQHLELSTYQHTIALEFIYVTLLLCVGYVTGRFGQIPTLFIILMVCGVCGILSALITIPIVAVYFLVILLVCGLATVVLNVITVDIFPTPLRAMAVCISLMMGRIGSVTGTNVVGGLLEYHCKSGLLIASISLILSGFLAFLLPRGKKTNVADKP